MSRALKTILGAVCGSALVLITLELALRVMPVQNGIAAGDPSADWPTHRLIANVHYTFSDAWNLRNVHRGVTNNMGYVAPLAYVPGTDAIAVVGNSFIEALMDQYQDTLQGQLAREVHDAPAILNFGTSGASLPDYVGLGPMVGGRFHLRWVVILVVGGDFAKGLSPPPGYFGWSAGTTPPVALRPDHIRTTAVQLIRSLAIVRYVRGNLRFDLRHFLHTSVKATPQQCVPEGLHAGDAELLASYADSLPVAYGLPPSRVILVFDSDRAELYRSHGARTESSCPTRDDIALRTLAAIAASRGEHVINMEQIFAAYFRLTGRRLDYSPLDYHWSAAAHRLAALEVAHVINGPTSIKPSVAAAVTVSVQRSSPNRSNP